MGAWSHTSFGNDDALDFVAAVAEEGEFAITTAFEDVNLLAAGDYLEAPVASMAIAAAEFVAAACGRPPEDFPEDAVLALPLIRNKLALKPAAVKAVSRVLDSSELRDLWADVEDFDKWRADVGDLLERLK
jgi:hypothetical protein